MLLRRLLADDWYGLVRREVVLVIREHKQVHRGDQAVCGIASRKINLMVLQRSREKAQIHDSWLLCKMQAVGRDHPLISVGTFHEFVAEACSPLRRDFRSLR